MGNQLFRRKSISKVLKDSEGGLTDGEHRGNELKRALSVRDLTAFGIAAWRADVLHGAVFISGTDWVCELSHRLHVRWTAMGPGAGRVWPRHRR